MPSVLRAEDNFDSSISGVGVGQTWQLPTRALNVEYTNDTGKPIQVAITRYVHAAATPYTAYFYVDDMLIINSSTAGIPSMYMHLPAFIIIPPGSTYKATGSGPITTWAELR